jgi:selenocysteine lyase/cysteine desulfurase
MKLLLELGVDQIAAELTRKSTFLRERLIAKGYSVLNADVPAENLSGIVSMVGSPEIMAAPRAGRADADLNALHVRLSNAGIVTSLRKDRAGRDYLRLSPHFYNTDAELERTLDLL